MCGQYGYNTSSKICKFANVVSIPSSALLNSSIPVYKVLTQSIRSQSVSLSGLVAKKLETTLKRLDDKRPGFVFHYPPSNNEQHGYLLLARPDPNLDGMPEVSIWDLDTQQLFYKYPLKADSHRQQLLDSISNPRTLRYQHPLLLNDGSLAVTAVGGPLLKINNCGSLITANEDFSFSHSLELGKDNFIYATMSYPMLDEDNNKTDFYSDQQGKNFSNYGFAVLDQQLNVVRHRLFMIFTRILIPECC